MEVTYKYPYAGYWNENYKYALDYDDGTTYLSGNYTHPTTSKNTMPNVSQMTVSFSIWSDWTSIFNRTWYLYAYVQNPNYPTSYSWETIQTYTMPEYTDNGDEAASGERYSATIKLNVTLSTSKGIKKIASVPSSRMGSAVTWSNSLDIVDATFTEDINEVSLSDGEYFSGIFRKRYSLFKDPVKVQVNMGGNLVTATDILVNTGGSELLSIPKMQIYNFTATEKEQTAIMKFVPTRSGTHRIENDNSSDGYAAFMIYDVDMNELYDYWTSYISGINLEAGKTYYIIIIDYGYYEALASCTLKIYSQ